MNFFSYAHLAWFSKPAENRKIFRSIARRNVKTIVEIGIRNAVRSARMIRVAQRSHRLSEIRFTGIDLFEASSKDANALSYKRAHQLLKSTQAKIRLIPGDPFTTLARTANELMSTDLIVVGSDIDAAAMARAWYYLPRMLHEQSLVYLEECSSGKDAPRKCRLLAPSEIRRLASSSDELRLQAA